MAEFDRWNSYFYAGTDVLINKPGLRDYDQLRDFEYEFAAFRSEQLEASPIAGNFDIDHLRKIHGHLFQDCYEWAGQLRDVGISKHTNFVEPAQLRPEGEKIHERLVSNNFLKDMDKATFVKHLATHYADLNKLHPFREGNGRATREYLSQLARQAGYALDQRRLAADKNAFNDAAEKSRTGDTRGIEKLFTEAIRPSMSVAFETLTREVALARHPALRSAFDTLTAKSIELKGRYPGNEKAQTHFLAQAKTEIIRSLDTGKQLAEKKDQEKPSAEQPPRSTFLEQTIAFAEKTYTDPVAREAFIKQMKERYAAKDQTETQSQAQARSHRLSRF